MEPVNSISRMGFRKWYERELIDSHVSLVTCVLSAFVAAACFETFTLPAPPLTALLQAGGMIGGAALTWASWLRYRRIMLRAWRFGEQAVCKQCTLYGRFNILASGAITPPSTEDEPHPASQVWMNVSCKRCGHTWRMPEPTDRPAR